MNSAARSALPRPERQTPLAANFPDMRLLHEVTESPQITQRDLSRRVGVALGLTNLILRRLIKKGAVKAKALNRRSVDYILTPRGMAEKLRKAYHYTLRAIRAHRAIQDAMEAIVRRELAAGRSSFCIVGEGELADLLALVLGRFESELRWARGKPENGAMSLVVTPEPFEAVEGRVVNVLQELCSR